MIGMRRLRRESPKGDTLTDFAGIASTWAPAAAVFDSFGGPLALVPCAVTLADRGPSRGAPTMVGRRGC